MKTYCRINLCQEHLFGVFKIKTLTFYNKHEHNINTVISWDITFDAITYNSQGEPPLCDVCLMEYDDKERKLCKDAIITAVARIDMGG